MSVLALGPGLPAALAADYTPPVQQQAGQQQQQPKLQQAPRNQSAPSVQQANSGYQLPQGNQVMAEQQPAHLCHPSPWTPPNL